MKTRLLLRLFTAAFTLFAAAMAFKNAATGQQAASPEPEIRFAGEFSNLRRTPEHAYGYSVDLWRDKGKFFGLLFASSGAAADIPTGLLDDLHYKPDTGTLSFTARLTLGSVYLGSGQQKPSQDFFTFKGTLRHNVISGLLTHVDKSQAGAPTAATRIRLPKTANPAPIEASTFEEWKRSTEAILKFRGPKW